jgi:hypothetical protein
VGLHHQPDLRPVLPKISCRHVATSTPLDLAELGEPNPCNLAHRPPLRIVFCVWPEAGKSGAMNSLTETKSIELTAVTKAPVKGRLFRACYLAASAIAMLGWLSAFGWATVAIAKWLFT